MQIVSGHMRHTLLPKNATQEPNRGTVRILDRSSDLYTPEVSLDHRQCLFFLGFIAGECSPGLSRGAARILASFSDPYTLEESLDYRRCHCDVDCRWAYTSHLLQRDGLSLGLHILLLHKGRYSEA